MIGYAYQGLSNFYGGFHRLFDAPRTRSDYDFQSNISGLPGMSWLADYHRNRELRQKQEHIWSKYGLDFNDVKYPWLSYAASPMRSVVTGVSRNAMTLYAWHKIPKNSNYYSGNYEYRNGAYYHRY